MPKETHNSTTCDLCGLPLNAGTCSAIHGTEERFFCCAGCKMVYAMLMEAADSPDPEHFKQTDLYRRCLAAGVVPGLETDQASINQSAIRDDTRFKRDPGDRTLTLEYRIEGMWCPACAWVIGAALDRMKGVQWTRCDFSTDRLRCGYDPVRTTPEQIERAVQRLGYKSASTDSSTAMGTMRGEFIRLAITTVLSANIMMLSWALYAGFFMPFNTESIRYISWPVFVMTTVVLLYGGGPMARKACSGLRHGAPGMEVLIVLGAGSAYLYSLFNWWSDSIHLYFDTAAMLITLLLLGKLLETLAKNRVRKDLEGFLSLQPTKVRLWHKDQPMGRYVAIEQLGKGDAFKVIPDEVIPADGRVLSGGALLDRSAISGEPRPVAVAAGDTVTSGSRVQKGEIVVRAEQVGGNALLGQMIDIVQDGLMRKTPLESRTDRMLLLFVPLVAGLALATSAVGYFLGLSVDQALVRGVTVLVIACPCALGIAIPLARVAGMTGAGRRGILVKNFQAFEKATQNDCVVLDKTGTVTHGRWTVESVEALNGHSIEHAVELAMALEQDVDHTIARALRVYGRDLGIQPAPLQDVLIHPDGISGRHKGREIRIGSRVFATRAPGGPAYPSAPHNRVGGDRVTLSEVFLSVDHEIWAVFNFGDRLRDDMPLLIQRLGEHELEPYLVSGDAPDSTRAVAEAIGIEWAAGGLLPQDKANLILDLQRQGRHAIMVGDGVNDAPALSRADLAVALHTGAPLAQHAADITLMRSDPLQLLDFLEWAPLVNRKVTQNLWWAMVYNAVSIPIAMTGLLNPIVAVVAMLLSSLSVIGNTLLLVQAPKKMPAGTLTGGRDDAHTPKIASPMGADSTVIR